ncbi:hypothetical protein QFH93_004894 [Escherichia coli]|nr:hypothetical protein [Escherichia coli]
MILKQDLKWSPDGMRVEVIRAGEYDDGALPAKSSKAAKEKKATTSKEG